MIQEENVKKQGDDCFAFDRSETQTSNPHEPTASVKKSGLEQRDDCWAKAGIFAGRFGIDRSAFAGENQLARSGAVKFWIGHDAAIQRPADHQSMADQISKRAGPHVDCTQAAQDPAYRQSCADASGAAVSDAVAGSQRQERAGLRVHPLKAQRCAADLSSALRGYRQNLGVMALLRSARIFQPFDPAQQTRAHVLGGRGHSVDFAAAGASIDCQHHRVSGDHPTQSRGGRLASSDDARGYENRTRINHLLSLGGINRGNALAIRLVKIARCQTFFCQPNLPKLQKSLYNTFVLILLIMGMKMTLAAAGLSAALAAGPQEANAQASEMVLPHPDGEIVIDVTRVALETQSEILIHMQACLGKGFTFADIDENGEIEGDERFDWDDERGFCAEIAESKFEQAALQDRIEIAEDRIDVAEDGIQMANANQAALRARAAAARAEMQAITDGVIAGAQQGDL